MTEVITLKPCRACRKGEEELKHYPSNIHTGTYVIYCLKCGAATIPCSSPEEAQAAWNHNPKTK